jgi:putative endonuclease
MENQNQRMGRLAEDAAADFLEKQGFTILERNYTAKVAEIDIIARDHDTLVFVEVKARKRFSRTGPREAVSWAKQQKIIMGARFFMREKEISDLRVRFDVVALYEENGTFQIELIRNAFQTD